jgi:BolA family transcriptional regulator, general stress-responsive regulator
MMQREIEKKLEKAFSPTFLKVKDESALHAGHASARPEGNSHFSVTIISPFFEGLNRIHRHQAIYDCLAQEFNEGLHALRLKTLTPEEAKAAESHEEV